MSKRTLITAGLFASIVGIVGWIAFHRSSNEPEVSVTFLAYTNDATGTRLAKFAVSNLNSFVVRRQAGYWIELPTSTGGTSQASRWFSSGKDLNGGAFEIVAVPVPTNQPSWRVLLPIRTDLGPVTEMMEFVGVVIFGPYSSFPQRKSYGVRSDWMEN